MRILVLASLAALLAGSALHAADERKLALESAAQADLDRVLAGGGPDLSTATKCVQSQAMLLAVATPEETAPIVFRKGYCAMASAAASHDRAAFSRAAETLDEAIADFQGASLKNPPQNLAAGARETPASWRILAAVARLNAGNWEKSQEPALRAAVDAKFAEEPTCESSSGAMEFCRTVHQLGSAWLGFTALERKDVPAATRRFTDSNSAPWKAWLSGLAAFRRADYAQASSLDGRAIGMWRSGATGSPLEWLYPKPAMSGALTEWAGAQLAAADSAAALSNLDRAVKEDSANARALYLRGVAKQRLGRSGAAIEDYNLAGRAALAETGETGTAEADFYRGVALYSRKDFQRAENAFADALNGEIAAVWQPDARAWRYLAAVAGGACGATRDSLTAAMGSVSPYFPKAEARAASAGCPVTAAALPIR